MGKSIACLAPEQETKPRQTDEGKRHRKRFPLWIQVTDRRESERLWQIRKQMLLTAHCIIIEDDEHQSTVSIQLSCYIICYRCWTRQLCQTASKVNLVDCRLLSAVCLVCHYDNVKRVKQGHSTHFGHHDWFLRSWRDITGISNWNRRGITFLISCLLYEPQSSQSWWW